MRQHEASLVVILGALASAGCQSAGPAALPAGPALISPNSSAANYGASGQFVALSGPTVTSALAPVESAQSEPVRFARTSPPRVIRPAAEKSLPSNSNDDSPFRLIGQEQSSAPAPRIAPALQTTPAPTGPVLKFETLTDQPPLGNVVSPRKLREGTSSLTNPVPEPAATVPVTKPKPIGSGATQAPPTLRKPLSPLVQPVGRNRLTAPVVPPQDSRPIDAVQPPAAKSDVSSVPNAEGDRRIKPLPPVDKTPRGMLTKPILPQPIPIYPEVPEGGQRAEEDL